MKIKNQLWISLLIVTFIFAGCEALKVALGLNDSDEVFSIIYPTARFKEKLDLENNPGSEDVGTHGIVQFIPTKHEIVGYLIKVVESGGSNILRIFTVAKDVESDSEVLVDKADFASTALAKRTANAITRTVISMDDTWATYQLIVGNEGFDRTNIEFLEEGFDRSFISKHDLSLIVKGYDFVSISGSKVTIGENFFPSESQGELKPEYFTWKIQGFSPEYPENYPERYQIKQSDLVVALNTVLTKDPEELYLRGEYKFIMKTPKFTKDIKFGLDPFSSESDAPAPSNTLHEMSFSSPCPPRWRPNG